MNEPDNPTPEQNPVVSRSKVSWWFLTMMLLAFIAFGFVFYRVYFMSQDLTETLSRVTHEMQANKDQISDLERELSSLRQGLQQQEAILQKQAQALQDWHNLSQVGPSGRGRDRSAILDAQYFIRLGGDQLLLSKDLPRAIQLFNRAQLELNRVSDPRVLFLKKALAQDIATLQGLPLVNTTKVYLSLTSLQQQIDSLPPLVVPVQKSEPSIEEPAPSTFWRVLSQMVVVYHLPNATTPPFITPDRRLALLENLHSSLGDAAWAVLRHDNVVYQSNLQQATSWVRQYFSLNSSITKKVIEELEALQTVSVQPPQDIVLVSPKAFEDYFKAETSETGIQNHA